MPAPTLRTLALFPAAVLLVLLLLAAFSAGVGAFTLFCGNHSRASAAVNVNPNCRDASAGPADVQEAEIRAALDTWSAGGSNFRFSFGGRTTRAAVAPTDGRHDVFWSDRADGSALAVTYCGDGDVERGADIENLDFFTFTSGTSVGYDIRTVDLHELGHLLGLGHTGATNAVMRGSYEGERRFLAADDIDGLRSLYGPDSRPPDVQSVSPDAGYVRGGNRVEVSGLSFAPDARVEFDGVPAPLVTREGNTKLVVLAPAWTISGQVVDVRVVQASGSDVLRDTYTYIENPVEIAVLGTPTRGSTVEVVVYGPPFQSAAVVAGAPGQSTIRGFTFCWDRRRMRVLGTLRTLSIPAAGQAAPIPIRLDGPAFLTFTVQGVVTTRSGLVQTNCAVVTILP